MAVTATGRPSRGRPFRHGSAEASAADRDRRRREYADLRARLSMPPADLAKLTGLSLWTVKSFPCWSSRATAPSEATLSTMRQELARRDRVEAAEFKARSRVEELRIRHEIELAEIERELDEHIALVRASEPDGLDPEAEDA